MTRTQERTLSMFILFINTVKKFSSITATIPTFTAKFGVLEDAVNELRDMEQQQTMQSSTLDAKNKKNVRMVCFTQLRTVSDSLNAYAVGTDNDALLQQVSVSIGKAKLMADTAFATFCETFYNLANPLATDLVPYGIDAALLTDFRANIDAFLVILSAPRENIINRADTTKKLADAFAKNKLQITKLATLAAIKRTSEPSFYNKLIESTKVMDTGATTIAFRVSLKDQDGLGLRAFTFTLVRVADGKVFEYKTNENGTIVRQFLKDGAYTVTIAKQGFTSFTNNIIVEDGVTYKLDAVANTMDKTVSF
jgi:hypothetical protein